MVLKFQGFSSRGVCALAKAETQIGEERHGFLLTPRPTPLVSWDDLRLSSKRAIEPGPVCPSGSVWAGGRACESQGRSNRAGSSHG